jgi:hypothetical protein
MNIVGRWGALLGGIFGMLALNRVFQAGAANIQTYKNNIARNRGLEMSFPVPSSAQQLGNSLLSYGPVWKLGANNPSLLLAEVSDLEGGEPILYTGSTTISIAAGNTKRVLDYHAISANVISKSSSDITVPMWNVYRRYLFCESASPFVITPVLCVMENGETVTNSDYNGNDMNTAIQAALGAEDIAFAMLPSIQGIPNGDNSLFRCQFNVDLTRAANLYSQYFQQKEIEEQTAKVFELVLVASGSAGQSITVESTHCEGLAQFRRGLL